MSTQVVRKSDEAPVPAQTETSAIISMIERAARDPAVDIDKMERLIAMRQSILAQEREQSFNTAMAAAQAEMRPVAADANNPQTRSKYASYFALDMAVRPIYTRHGFALSFNTEPGAPDGHIRVVCFVSCAGHTRRYQWDAPADGKGAKGGDVMSKTHAAGSAMTYAQRYLLKAIFNIAIGGDDDGNQASPGEVISEHQADELRNLVAATATDINKFLRYFRIESITEMPASRFDDAVKLLKAKVK